MSPAYVQRTPVDFLEVDGESLVLFDQSRVVRLSPIATAVFALATSPQPLAALAASIEASFGPPPEGTTAAATAAVIAELRAAGLLEEVAGD